MISIQRPGGIELLEHYGKIGRCWQPAFSPVPSIGFFLPINRVIESF